jgi:hypothetical protein
MRPTGMFLVSALVMTACTGTPGTADPSAAPSDLEGSGGSLRLVVEPERVPHGQIPSYVVVNDTGRPVGIGHGLLVDRKEASGWRQVDNPGCAVTREMWTIPPGARSEPADLSRCTPGGQRLPFKVGEYRIMKDVQLSEGERTRLRARFSIEDA